MTYRVPDRVLRYEDLSREDIDRLVRRGCRLRAEAMATALGAPFSRLRQWLRAPRALTTRRPAIQP